MSYLDYKFSMGPVVGPKADPPFDGLIMAAMRRADTTNIALLRAAWPDVWVELALRYESPGGLLPDDADALFDRVASDNSVSVEELRELVTLRAARVCNDVVL